MATRTVFSDDDSNEMDCFLNKDGKLYLGIQKIEEDPIYSVYITLDKEDVSELIEILQGIKAEMP